MRSTLHERLAAALRIDPADIRAARPDADGRYTVILADFRKLTGIEPAPDPAPPDPAPQPDPGARPRRKRAARPAKKA